MTTETKKPRRRTRPKSKAGGKENLSQTKPVEAESEQKPQIDPKLHAKITSQALGITTMDTIKRINSIPDLSKELGENWLENMIINVAGMELSEIRLRLKTQKMSAIEQSVYIMVAKMLKEDKSQEQIIKDIWTRVAGGPRQRTEITGAGGGAIQIEQEKKQSMEEFMASMSKPDRKAYMEMLKQQIDLKKKYAQEGE